MDNNNSEAPVAGAGPVPPVAGSVNQPVPPNQPEPQPVPVQPMPAPQPVPEQPAPVPPVVEQPAPVPPVAEPPEMPQPEQPMPSPAMEQPIVSGPVDANNQATTDAGAKKKTGLIVGCLVGAGVVIAAIVAVLFLFVFKGGGEKTVSCTASATAMGISIDLEYNVNIKDGEIPSGEIITNVNLKTMSDLYKKREKEIVDSLVDSYKSQCDDGCSFSHDYVEGDHVKLTMKYEGEGTSKIVRTYGIEGKSAQEIADKVQESIEKTDSATCKQL